MNGTTQLQHDRPDQMKSPYYASILKDFGALADFTQSGKVQDELAQTIDMLGAASPDKP